MSNQEFREGDLVRIADDLDAIVLHSYADKYGGEERGQPVYAVFLQDRGSRRGTNRAS